MSDHREAMVVVPGASSAKIAKELDATFWVSVGVLILIAIVGGGIVMWWRGKALGTSSSDTSAGVAESLRKMRESGELSQEEYDRARKRLVERTLGTATNPGANTHTTRSGGPDVKPPPRSEG